MAEYEEGKVYLMDTRNRQIYLYERHLAANGNFRPVIPNKGKQKPEGDPQKQTQSDGDK